MWENGRVEDSESNLQWRENSEYNLQWKDTLEGRSSVTREKTRKVSRTKFEIINLHIN